MDLYPILKIIFPFLNCSTLFASNSFLSQLPASGVGSKCLFSFCPVSDSFSQILTILSKTFVDHIRISLWFAILNKGHAPISLLNKTLNFLRDPAQLRRSVRCTLTLFKGLSVWINSTVGRHLVFLRSEARFYDPTSASSLDHHLLRMSWVWTLLGSHFLIFASYVILRVWGFSNPEIPGFFVINSPSHNLSLSFCIPL